MLETIVTAAPLLGLLGTITGMIRAFRLFGAEGLVDPRGVTGGVAEALIATAVGLFIALVALFAFNYFSHRQGQRHGRDGAARHAARRPHPAGTAGGSAVKFRRSRQRRRGRIEIIPMIDVMFFLLATFMLASLSLQNLHSMAVDLPRGQAPLLQTARSVTLTVTRDGALLLDQTAVTLDTLAAAPAADARRPGANVIVAVDSAAPSGVVVQAMLKARDGGAEHFLFAVAPK